MKYKVLVGRHVQRDRTYTKGEIVDTSLPLDRMFPNKFQAVHSPPPELPSLDEGEADDDTSIEEEALPVVTPPARATKVKKTR